MKRNITLGHLDISPRGRGYVLEALKNNRLSRGKFTEQFESDFARFHESKYAVFMNSGTSALQVALAALKEVYNYQDGDEVIVPAMTFIATSNIVLQNNMKPVFVDVEPDTFNIDVSKIAEKITSKTRCIIPVHLFGLPADMFPLMDVAKKHGLQVLEDSCETMFASDRDKSVGSFGDLACFSTYVAHLIVGGVGGIVTTSNRYLAELCRSFMAHGRDSIYLSIDDDDNKGEKLQGIIERRYSFDRVGYSYRATELEAAIALSELDRSSSNIFLRRRNAMELTRLLEPFQNFLQLPVIPKGKTHSFMMYPMVVKEGIDRADLLLFLEENGIETRYLLPLLSQPIYQRLFPGQDDENPIAKHLAANGFFIGIHQGLSIDDIGYIAEVFQKYFQRQS
jgi:perosamine synthetase